jgi:hypothetical protein
MGFLPLDQPHPSFRRRISLPATQKQMEHMIDAKVLSVGEMVSKSEKERPHTHTHTREETWCAWD